MTSTSGQPSPKVPIFLSDELAPGKKPAFACRGSARRALDRGINPSDNKHDLPLDAAARSSMMGIRRLGQRKGTVDNNPNSVVV